MTAPDMLIYCADIGSVRNPRKSKFGWVGLNARTGKRIGEGDMPDQMARSISQHLEHHPVSLGFECPLWIPIPDKQAELGAGRPDETGVGIRSRPWSGGAGPAVLATGIAQSTYILRSIKRAAKTKLQMKILSQDGAEEWRACSAPSTLYLWEAFVSFGENASDRSAQTHIKDAKSGAHQAQTLYESKTPLPGETQPAEGTTCLSLIGVAALYAGLLDELSCLMAPPLVIHAQKS